MSLDPPPRLVIFDFDGVLADSAAWTLAALGPLSRRFGLRVLTADEIAMLRGRPNREIVRYMRVPFWRMPAIARAFRSMSAADAGAIPLFPGVPDLLDRLAGAGLQVAVVSSNGEETVRRVLGASSRRIAYFSCGAGLFGKARRFAAVARAAGVPRQAVLCVGDETRDIEAARQARMACAAVTWGYATEEVLIAAEPDLLVRSLGELEAAVLPGA